MSKIVERLIIMKIFSKKKNAQALQTITSIIAPIVGIAIVLAVGFLILAEVKEQASSSTTLSTDSYAWNATGEVQGAMDDIPGWLPIIIVAIIGAALLSLVALFRSR